MNPIFLDLGFFQIYWYSIFILCGMIIASVLFYKALRKEQLSDEFITNLIFYGIIFGIIGARLYYVIFNFSYYSKNLIEILKIWEAGLAIHGGIIGGLIFFYFYSKKYNVSLLKITDAGVVGLIIAQAIGRFGNFFNGEVYGFAVTKEFLQRILVPNFIIKGMYINGSYHLPLFYFESIWNVSGFILLLLIRKYYKKLKAGQLTGIYFMWYSFGRFFLEFLREEQYNLMLGNIKVSSLVSVLLFILGFILVIYKRKDTRITRLERKQKDGKNL